MRKGILTLLLYLLFQHIWAQAPQFSLEQKREKIDSMINTWSKHGLFNGGILIAQKGKIIYQRSEGYANFEKGILNTDTTRYNLASISKPITAISILQLVEQKKLNLTDPFVRYFPNFPYPAVTITQLLTHTSGLPEADQYEKSYIAAHPAEVLSNQRIYDDLLKLKVPALAAAGEKHFYNNLNYILLAMLLEKVTETPFALYLKKNIFARAGMKKTYVCDRISPNTARYVRPTFYDTSYQHVDSIRNRKIYTDYPLGGTYGDNNVVTTMQDVLKFDQALNTGKLLSPDLVKALYQPVKLANGEHFFTGGKKTYTLGWNVNEKNALGQFAAWHDGSLVGHTTMLFKNLTDELTYIMYENRNTPGFFMRYLAISQVMDNVKINRVSLQKSLVREYGAALVGKGPHCAAARLNALKSDPDWYFNEHEMNELGYELLRKSNFSSHRELAVEVFKLNTLLSPENANVYDSYAEGLMSLGLKAEAILMYQKVLKLNPNNEVAKENLKRLME